MKMLSKSLVLIFLFSYSTVSHAYLDPGNIFYVIQLVMSFVAGCFFYLKRPSLLRSLVIDSFQRKLEFARRERTEIDDRRNVGFEIILGSTLIISTFLTLPIIPKSSIEIFRGFSPYIAAQIISIFACFAVNAIFIYLIFRWLKKGIFQRVLECIYLGIIFSVLVKSALISIDMSWSWLRDLIWINPSFVTKVIWVFLLPGVCFGIFFFGQVPRRRVEKLLFTFGLALFLIPATRFVGSIAVTDIARWENPSERPVPTPSRKVIWITFDEFDPLVAFSEENLRNLGNFDAFLSKSVNAKKNSSPANNTEESIIAALLGRPTSGLEFLGTGRAVQRTPEDSSSPLVASFENSIFRRVDDLGLNSQIIGFGVPYCELFSEVPCKAFFPGRNVSWYSGIFEVFAHSRAADFVGLQSAGTGDYANISNMLIQSVETYLEGNLASLSVIHLNFPHLPSSYAESFFSENPETGFQQYLLNLRLSDAVLGGIIDALSEKGGDDETLIILNSDHWLRWFDPDGFVKASPSLLLAQIKGDSTKIEIETPTSSVHINEMIIKFLKGEINSHRGLANFYRDRRHFEAHISVN